MLLLKYMELLLNRQINKYKILQGNYFFRAVKLLQRIQSKNLNKLKKSNNFLILQKVKAKNNKLNKILKIKFDFLYNISILRFLDKQNFNIQIEIMKSFYIAQKKVEYKKHIKRLQNIYEKSKAKTNLKKYIMTMDKLMSNSHKIHEISNRSKVVKKKSDQITYTTRDWTSVHSHVQSLPKNLGGFSIPKIVQKYRRQQNDLNKRNFDIIKRLIRVKPTINLQNDQNALTTSYHKNLNEKQLKNGDFTNILNLSRINKQSFKKINIKLNSIRNQQFLKIRFSSQIQQILNENKIYYLAIKTQIHGKSSQVKQSECFSVNQIFKGQLFIFKKTDDKIKLIQLRELILNQIQSISKGYFDFRQILNMNNQQKDHNIQFYPTFGKRSTTILIHVEKKRIKKKILRNILDNHQNNQAIYQKQINININNPTSEYQQ